MQTRRKVLRRILMGALLAMTAGCELPRAEAPQMEQIVWKFGLVVTIGRGLTVTTTLDDVPMQVLAVGVTV